MSTFRSSFVRTRKSFLDFFRDFPRLVVILVNTITKDAMDDTQRGKTKATLALSVALQKLGVSAGTFH
jgi:hypothetical protein